MLQLAGLTPLPDPVVYRSVPDTTEFDEMFTHEAVVVNPKLFQPEGHVYVRFDPGSEVVVASFEPHITPDDPHATAVYPEDGYVGYSTVLKRVQILD